MVDQLTPIAIAPAPQGPERIADELGRAGVPSRFRSRSFTGFEEVKGAGEAVDAAQAIARRPHSLLLSGPLGTGKTHLVVAILADMAAHGRLYDRTFGRLAARFVGVPELLDELRESMRYPQSDDPMRPLVDVPLLVLDDLGSEQPTDWVAERLYVLINRRYGAELATVVTSNYGPAELRRRGYGRIVSRLMEDAEAIQITASSDYRLR